MNANVKLMLAALDLTSVESSSAEDVFVGPSIKMPHNRIFGGQVLAQCLTAAMRTVEQGRRVHSMHGYFLRKGDDTQPVSFSVDRIHDGRSFSTRRTQAYQNGVPIFSMIGSFQDEDSGLDHYAPMPSGIPQPEDLPSPREVFAHIQDPRAEYWSSQRPFEIRYPNGPIYIEIEGPHVAQQSVWLKCVDPLPADQNIHLAAMAYASDYSILEPIYRRHGVPWTTPGLKAASLDHAMWFHRPVKADEWMLYVLDSPSAQGGRGLSLGRIYSRDGVLVASVAQEGTIRVPGI
jgi:acyl-CoA thioesterase-2